MRNYYFSQIIKSGETVFDLGANSGLHSILFSKLVGSRGRVYSFEPLPNNIVEIEQVVAINKLHNLEIVKMAVSDTCGEARFHLGIHNKQGSLQRSLDELWNDVESTISVGVTTLDNFIEKRSIIPDFIKMDIEGGEGAALIGCNSSLERFQPLLSIELHSPEQDVLVGTTLAGFGYELYRFDPQNRRRVELERIKIPTVGWPNRDGTWGTVLAVPKKHSERIKRLKRFGLQHGESSKMTI